MTQTIEELCCCCRSGPSNGFQLRREERCPTLASMSPARYHFEHFPVHVCATSSFTFFHQTRKRRWYDHVVMFKGAVKSVCCIACCCGSSFFRVETSGRWSEAASGILAERVEHGRNNVFLPPMSTFLPSRRDANCVSHLVLSEALLRQ